jgi:P27 family predicted phage terminase small subunit
MPGPAKKPTVLKILEGNPGKKRLNINEPQPQPSMPSCPPHLKGVARTEWKRIVPELYELGLLSNIDRMALAAYCDSYAEWKQACELLERKSPILKTEAGNIIQNPLVGIKHKAAEQMHKFLTEFGMTPASRSRIQVNRKPDNEDDMEKLLNGKRN